MLSIQIHKNNFHNLQDAGVLIPIYLLVDLLTINGREIF